LNFFEKKRIKAGKSLSTGETGLTGEREYRSPLKKKSEQRFFSVLFDPSDNGSDYIRIIQKMI